eukprot:TRINITY_DN4754_c0_g1_i1.p1 TRINITY_DN4754_c0_g1~~TRINITY_DN4754_c0_g1_i1.p1  ORF type:complete len:850 (+),score=215.22 TRINITY_DN4754_c0_g1_i1:79-2628(+)
MFNLIADPKNKKADKTVRWIKFKPHGRPPSARAAGSATKIADHLVLFFGGYCSEDGDGTYYNDVHIFNLKTKEWENTTNKFQSQGPSPRSGHGAVYINNKLYVFGGSNYFQSRLHYNDMYILDLEKKTWSKPEQHGDVPCPRTQFSFTAVGDCIYLFGGDLVHSNRYFGDLYEYNTRTYTWRYLFPEGTGPSPRVGHSANAVGRQIFFFGGHFEADRLAPNSASLLTNGNFNDVHILDLDRNEWLKPSVSGNVPTPRSWHSAVTINNRLYIFGGTSFDDRDATYNDIHYLDTDTFVWSYCDIEGVAPPPTFYHVSVHVYNKIFSFGGVVHGGGDQETKYTSECTLLDTSERQRVSVTVSPSILTQNMLAIVNNSKFSDIQFVIDNKTLYAHKIILACLCPELLKIYKQPKNTVENIKFDAFFTFLQWIYSGDLYEALKGKKRRKRLLAQLKEFVKVQLKLSYLAVEIKSTIDRLAEEKAQEQDRLAKSAVERQKETVKRESRVNMMQAMLQGIMEHLPQQGDNNNPQEQIDHHLNQQITWEEALFFPGETDEEEGVDQEEVPNNNNNNNIDDANNPPNTTDNEMITWVEALNELSSAKKKKRRSMLEMLSSDDDIDVISQIDESTSSEEDSAAKMTWQQALLLTPVLFSGYSPLAPNYSPLIKAVNVNHLHEYCDVTFVVQGRKIDCHKIVLYARCPHFRHMFDSGMAESHKKEIVIPEEKAETFQDLLHYIYSDDLDHDRKFTTESLIDLACLAHSYDLPRLTQCCEVLLANADLTTVENILDFVVFSEEYAANQLLEHCLYVGGERWIKLAKTKGFKKQAKDTWKESMALIYEWAYKSHKLRNNKKN